MNIINSYIKQLGIGNINTIQSVLLPNSITGSSSNIFSNFAAASAAFSMLNNVLGANAGLNFSFSPSSLFKFTNNLEKFLTVKEPIGNPAENNQALNNLINDGDEQTPKTENKASVETTEKQPQTENKAAIETTEKQPQDITSKTVKEESKPENKSINPKILAPTCYLIGQKVGGDQDLTPEQIKAREAAQADNNEILEKLK